MMFLRYLIIFMLSVKCFAQMKSATNYETIAFQKEIISKLTGEKPINGKNKFLLQRSTAKERELTADYLLLELKRLGLNAEKQNYTTTNSNIFLDLFYAPAKGINVVGELYSTIPSNKYVIIGAHYDTERGSPGAIDNATGIALILDVVKKMADIEVRNTNFMAVFFDQEEDNEIGSREFVKMIKKKDKDIESVHIIDLIGWDANNNKKISLQSCPAFLARAYQNSALELGVLIQTIEGASSDNKSFMNEGYNTVLVSDEIGDTTPYYHSSKDDISTVNFNYLALASHLLFKTLQAITNEEY